MRMPSAAAGATCGDRESCKSVFSFEDDDFAASHGHFAGDGKADGTGADDGAINFVHVRRVDSVNDAGKSWRPKCAGA